MIVEILKPYKRWKEGDAPDVTKEKAAELIEAGIARIHDDQTRRDYTPKAEKEEEPQKIEVHNYFVQPEEEKPKRKKSIFKRKR